MSSQTHNIRKRKGGAELYSGKKRAVMRLPKGFRSMGPINRQALRTGGWANPTQGPEVKFKDTNAATTLAIGAATFTTPAAALLLNGLVPDSTATGRIGRKVAWKSLYMRWTAAIASTTTLGGCVRTIIVYDKQANAAAPAVTDILLVDDFHSPNNLSNRDRFVTLVDHVSTPISAINEFVSSNQVYKKINLETMFNAGTAGTIGDITSGSIYVMFAQSGNMGVAAATVTWRARLRYTDN